MIRKAVIVALSLLALTFGGLWGASAIGPMEYARIKYLPPPVAGQFAISCFSIMLAKGQIIVQDQVLTLPTADLDHWSETLPEGETWVWQTRYEPGVWGHVARELEATGWNVTRQVFGWSPNALPAFRRGNAALAGNAMLAACPFYLAILFAAAYPLAAFIRGPLRRGRRRKRALCVPCGYDLRGSASGVCPECGEPT